MADPAAINDNHQAAPLRRLYAYFLAHGGTATLMMAAFPGLLEVSWPWAAYVALAPAGWAAANAHCMRRLAWTAYVVWFAFFLVMLRWLMPVTGGGYALLAALMAIYPTVAIVVFRLLYKRLKLPGAMVLPLAWVTLELARSHWPEGGMGWFLLAHSQAPFDPGHGVSRVIQMADVFGELGVSFVLAMTSGVIVDVIAFLQRRRGKLMLTGTIVLWALAFIGAWVYGQYRINEFERATQPSLRVALVQTNIPQDNKVSPTPQQVEADWQRLLALTREAMAQGPFDLIVWPETTTPGPLNAEATAYFRRVAEFWKNTTAEKIAEWDDAEYYQSKANEMEIPLPELPPILAARYQLVADAPQTIAALAREAKAAILVGSASETGIDKPATSRRYNSVYLFHPDGTVAPTRYDKIHRVPFGEYIPWVEGRPWLKQLFMQYVSPYDHDYTLTPGKTFTVFDVQPSAQSEIKNQKSKIGIVTPICFEDVIARVCRSMIYDRQGRKRADLLVNLTNDAWYHPIQRVQHLQIAVFRSVENRVPTARSVNTGVSGFIDSIGRVNDARSNRAGEGFVIHQVRTDARQAPYGQLGDRPVYFTAALTGILTLLALLMPKNKNHSKREPTR